MCVCFQPMRERLRGEEERLNVNVVLSAKVSVMASFHSGLSLCVCDITCQFTLRHSCLHFRGKIVDVQR